MSSKRELILIGRWVLPSAWYINLNKYVMSVIFFVPLSSELIRYSLSCATAKQIVIALFESQVSHTRSDRLRAYFSGPPPEEEGDPKIEDPGSDDPKGQISKVSFEELVKVFPK